MAKIDTVNQYLTQHENWKTQLSKLREILLSHELSETIKWGAPVYTKDGKNLIGIGAFKNHYGLWFFQGALLKRNTEHLVNAQEGKTQAMRQIKFDINSELDPSILGKYIKETIELHVLGKTVKLAPSKKVEIPAELKSKMINEPEFYKAFKSLTPGKQKEYSLYIIEAKREATKLNRIEKIKPMILARIGLNDKYKS